MKIVFLTFLAISSCGIIKDGEYQEDNLAEEIIEEVIEARTGLNLDLTPNSNEKKR